LRRTHPGLFLACTAAILWAAGCGKEPAPLPGAGDASAGDGGNLPQGHPPIAGMESTAPAPTGAPGERVLKPEGIGSESELAHCIAHIDDAATKARFEEGFRACFTSMQALRDYELAAAAARDVLGAIPDFAPAYRVLAYARLNTGFDMQGATELYEKAVQADPNYGEAHYALSFMLTQSDPERGRIHFEKAMELGIPDERNLRSRFYPSGT
jgi:hypothetical protein